MCIRDRLSAKEVIPRNLRVSTFVYYIDVLAAEKNLTSRSLSAADTQVTIRQTGKSKEDSRTYLGVSSVSYTHLDVYKRQLLRLLNWLKYSLIGQN